MGDKAEFVFWLTLILYIITLVSVPYVGVYLKTSRKPRS
jgi:hypothetical protein